MDVLQVLYLSLVAWIIHELVVLESYAKPSPGLVWHTIQEPLIQGENLLAVVEHFQYICLPICHGVCG